MKELTLFERNAIRDYEREKMINEHRLMMYEGFNFPPGRTMTTESWGVLNSYIDRTIKPLPEKPDDKEAL